MKNDVAVCVLLSLRIGFTILLRISIHWLVTQWQILQAPLNCLCFHQPFILPPSYLFHCLFSAISLFSHIHLVPVLISHFCLPSGYSGNRETHWIFIAKMNWLIKTYLASRGFAPCPWSGACYLSLIFQSPFFLKSSNLCWLAQLTWNASRIWSDGECFLCPQH